MTKQNIANFGWGNLVTIIIVLGGMLFNYATNQQRLENLESKVDVEIVERKTADDQIRAELLRISDQNREDHLLIINSLTDLRIEVGSLKYTFGGDKKEE